MHFEDCIIAEGGMNATATKGYLKSVKDLEKKPETLSSRIQWNLYCTGRHSGTKVVDWVATVYIS